MRASKTGTFIGQGGSVASPDPTASATLQLTVDKPCPVSALV